MKSSGQISLFLASAKAFVEKNGLLFVERDQSVAFLAARGLLIEDLERLILELTIDDCTDGPEADRNPRYSSDWTVAEFGPALGNERIYLKISIRLEKQRCKCLSVKLWTEREHPHD